MHLSVNNMHGHHLLPFILAAPAIRDVCVDFSQKGVYVCVYIYIYI